jgi:putative ABC transport system permease protein
MMRALVRTVATGFDGVMVQRGRATFTALGVSIGVVALISVGSLVYHLSQIIDVAERLNVDQLLAVFDRTVWLSDSADREVADLAVTVRGYPGVATVTPIITVPYDLAPTVASLRPLAYIFEADAVEAAAAKIRFGVRLRFQARDAVLVGSDFAAASGVSRGDRLSLLGSAFRVQEMLRKTYSIYDNALIVSHDSAVHLMRQTLPSGVRRPPLRPSTALLVELYPNADRLAVTRAIDRLPDLRTFDPLDQVIAVRTTLGAFQAIMLGSSLIAVLVAVLSVLNTMSMAVSERFAEIGLRKALGATKKQVLHEVIAEAAILGLSGAIVGALLSLAAASAEAGLSGSLGVSGLFDPVPAVAVAAIAAVVGLSVLAGIIPAFRAAGASPIESLRSRDM